MLQSQDVIVQVVRPLVVAIVLGVVAHVKEPARVLVAVVAMELAVVVALAINGIMVACPRSYRTCHL